MNPPDQAKSSLTTDKAATKRVRIIAGVAFLLGIIGLSVLERVASTHQSLGWFYSALLSLGLHTCELLGSVGLVGILLEFYGHRELANDIVAKIRTLFRVEPDFAKSLSPEMQRKFVESTLRAHLGEDIGEAIFSGLVQRYLGDRGMYREGVEYEVDIDVLNDDAILSGASLNSGAYFSLLADYRFTRPFAPEMKYIACTFSEDFVRLFKMFTERKYIAREVMQIESAHQDSFSKLLESKDPAIREKMKATVGIELHIERKEIPQLEKKNYQGGIVVEFDIPSNIPTGKPTEYQVKIRGLVARSAEQFPVIISELARDPKIIFRHPRDLMVMPVHFLTGDPSSRPQIRSDPGRIEVTCQIRNSWVFANSGVVFTWKR